MPAPVDQIIIDVAAQHTVIDSAIVLIKGFPTALDAAVTAALANGATAAQLAPLTELSTATKAKSQELADAVVANTPQANQVKGKKP